MRKAIKFSEHLCELVLSGAKNTTWRVDDDKEIVHGDTLSLQTPSGKEFARARVESVKETTFGKLDAEDREGHEAFPSQDALLTQYSEYYKKKVSNDTRVKVVKFKLE